MRADPSKYIPTSADTSEQWIEWHRTLKKWFNRNEANAQWLRFWNQRAGAGSDADTRDLRQYMESEGVNLTTDVSGAMADSVLDAVDWVGDTFKWVRNIVIGTVLLVLALITFYIVTNALKGKSASQMAMELPFPRRRTLNFTKLLT